jgi:uncharacterized repeat protein (TIGR04138 family)
MSESMPDAAMMRLLQEDQRFPLDGYIFVYQALAYAQNVLEMGADVASDSAALDAEEEEADDEADDAPSGPERHVTGQQLCEAIRQFALEQYGYMAKTVLNCWGIHTTGDFGDIVFNLIRIGRMRKTPDDSRADFENVYDFETAFQQDFRITPSAQT